MIEARRLSTLPRVKIKVMAIMKAREPLTMMDQIIALGRVIEASCISSDICTEQSYPTITLKGVVRPIIADNPTVGQPPLFWKTSKVSCAGARGPKTQSGIMMANRPQKCINKTTASMRGSLGAKTVLKAIENTMTAIVKRVP